MLKLGTTSAITPPTVRGCTVRQWRHTTVEIRCPKNPDPSYPSHLYPHFVQQNVCFQAITQHFIFVILSAANVQRNNESAKRAKVKMANDGRHWQTGVSSASVYPIKCQYVTTLLWQMAKNTKKTLPTSIEMGSVQFSDDCSNGFITSVEEIGDEQGNERGNGDAHKARHHKRVVEQIFTYDGST